MCRHTHSLANNQASHVVLFILAIEHAFELYRKGVNVTDDHVATVTVAIPTRSPEHASFAMATGEMEMNAPFDFPF